MTVSLALNPSQQDEVFTFLMDPATHGGAPVTRIDTHAASVFLAGPRALKIKRAVRFPFLDYSTLAKRKEACDEELRINRPFAPDIYRGVVPITRRDDGSLTIGGDGMPVEWAVEMARFDERLTLDHVAEAGEIKPDLARDIADAIAASHAIAPLAPAAPWIDSIPVIVARNTAVFRTAGLAVHETDALDGASHAAFIRGRELLERRGRQGHVRRCHGDLHLSNLVLIDGKPVLFDAIEFDPAIASVDVLYDLAFPLMDLLHTASPRPPTSSSTAIWRRRRRITSTRCRWCRCSCRCARRSGRTSCWRGSIRAPLTAEASGARRSIISRWRAG